MAFRNILETFSEEEQLARLHEMDADECDALFELLMLGALIDGELSAEEADILVQEFEHLPFFSIAHSSEVTGEHGFLMRGKILERIAAGETEAMLDSIAERMPSEDHRLAALRALALVAESEGVADDEQSLAFQAAAAFEIPVEAAMELLRKAWEFNHGPFSE